MTVEHDEAGRKFFVRLDEGEGVLTYTESQPGVLNLTHTLVDEPIRNRGVASKLTEAAFDYAERNGYRVVPTCPYVKRWVDDRPERQALVAE